MIEGRIGKSFTATMRELLRYDAKGYTHTWMPTLEPMPTSTQPLIYQYWDKQGWDNHALNISVDLYGGGGIACTASDLARFNRTPVRW